MNDPVRLVTDHSVVETAVEIKAHVTESAPMPRHYAISGLGLHHHPDFCEWDAPVPCGILDLYFQSAAPGADGRPNGITNEHLISVVIDRLEAAQRSQFACAENAKALDLLVTAREVLFSRTLRRVERGVEGTQKI